MKALGLVNENVVLLYKAHVPLADNGFLLGDGVFETMRTTRSGKLFRPDLHVARAQQGLTKLLIDIDISKKFIDTAEKLRQAAVNEIGNELYIRINISTGTKQDWSSAPELAFTGVAKALPAFTDKKLVCKTWSGFSEKHTMSDVKSLSYARSATLRRKVKQEKLDDIILINTEGKVVEASMSNVIARKGSTVYAPGREVGALPGTTRHILVCELLDKTKYITKEDLTEELLHECNEVMLTSSISGVKKVAKINNSDYKNSELFDELSNRYSTLLD